MGFTHRGETNEPTRRYTRSLELRITLYARWRDEYRVLPTCPTKEVHVNLFQEVDGESVDLREKAHQEGDGEAVGET